MIMLYNVMLPPYAIYINPYAFFAYCLWFDYRAISKCM